MFCSNCGAKLSDTARFCGSCGFAVMNSEVPVQPAANNVSSGENTVSVPPVSVPMQNVPLPDAELVQNAPAAPVQDNTEIIGEMAAPADVPASASASKPEPVQEAGVLPPDQSIFSGEGSYSSPSQSVGSGDPAGYYPQQYAQNDFVPPPIQTEGSRADAPVQPEYAVPAPATAAVRPARIPRKKLNLGVTILISVLFGILSFSLITASFAVGSVRQGLSENVLSDGIEDLELGEIVVGDLLSDPALEQVVRSNGIILPEKKVDKAELAEIISLSIRVNSGSLTPDQIEEFISRLEINEELAVLVRAYEDYIVTGKPGDEFSDGIDEEIKRIVKNGERHAKDIFNMRLSDDYEERLDKILNDNQEMIDSILPENSLKGLSGVFGVVFNPIVLIAGLVLSVALVALIWVISKRVTAALMTGGVVFALIGGVLIAASMIVQNLTMIPALDFRCVEEVISPLLYNTFGSKLLYSGLICVGTGIVLIIAFIIIKVVSKSRQNREAAQQL